MLRNFLFYASLLLGTQAWAQPPVVYMSGGSYTYCNAQFFDSGGPSDYADFENNTLSLCPGTPGAHVQVAFSTFSLGAGDALTIYDGPAASGVPLETGTGTSLAGLVVASTDPGGCLTLVFTSDASGTGAGWDALITCDIPCDPPTAIIAPGGLVQACPGTTVNLDGTASTGAPGHYVASYQWNVDGVPSYDLVLSQYFPDAGQYAVDLSVWDEIGCMSATPALVDVRIATTPDFDGTSVSDDQVCLGTSITLDAQVNAHTWTNVPQPVVAGLTPLPDGSGVSYSTPVLVTGFPAGTIISSPTDIQRVCMVIEHSFLGDMTISLTCPGGQEVLLFDGYNGSGGGTYLGSPLDNLSNGTGVPGTGAQYCFASTAAWATLLDEDAAGNHVTAGDPPLPSMTPGTYTSEEPFTGWNGCDLNGNWTITMTDNISADDGFIFSWWLEIEPALYPNVITFTPVYDLTTAAWSGPGVGATAPDGTATATPTAQGTADYTYTVTDDFGCSWDTTLTVTVDPPLVAFVASELAICDNADPADLLAELDTDDGNAAPAGGTWTSPDGGTHSGLLDPTTDVAGTYSYVLGEGTTCESSGSVEVTLGTHVNAGDDQVLAYCSSDEAVDLFPLITGAPGTGGTWLLPDGSLFDGELDPATDPTGTYSYFLLGTTPCPNDTAFLDISIPQAVNAGTDATYAVCVDADPFSLLARLGGTPDATGTWTGPDQGPVSDVLDPATGVSGPYTYTMTAVAPCPDRTATLDLTVDRRPRAGTDAVVVACAGDADVPLFPLLGAAADEGGQWSDPDRAAMSGALDPSLERSGTYSYLVSGPGTCAHLTDTALVDVTIHPMPVITFTTEPDSGCSPLLVRFTNTTDPIYVGGDCAWTFGDGSPEEAGCGTIEHLYTTSGWYHVQLRVTTPEGCTDELVKPGNVLVDPVPQATFTWTPDPATGENSTVVFTATDPYATTFEWTLPDGTTTTGPQFERTFENALSGTYPVCLVVADRYGCMDTLCNDIKVVVPSLFVPNAFTPNGDGDNDVFQPAVAELAQDDLELRIFDRWGQVIFASTGTAKGWDGRHSSGGDVLPEGVYVWKLSARPRYAAEKEDHYGFVTLLK